MPGGTVLTSTGTDLRAGAKASVLRDVARHERGPLMGAVLFAGRLANRTFQVCMRYRVTGLAAEAGFFALMSLPPLVLGMIAGVGLVGRHLGNDVVLDLRLRISELAGSFLTPGVVSSVILPTFDEVLAGGRVEIMSLAFLLSLWSGSRALNVYVDTITIMYGLGGKRGIVRTRALSFSLYAGGLLLGMFLMPLVLMGPQLLSDLLGSQPAGAPPLKWLGFFYWPAVVGLTVLGLTTLYHVATPLRSPWLRDLPGAVLALVIWVLSSFVLRVMIAASVGGVSIYGPLATPIIVMIWLYFIAIAVLIGAALNAALDELFGFRERAGVAVPADPADPTGTAAGPAAAARTAEIDVPPTGMP